MAGMLKEIEQQNEEISKLSNKILSLESKKRGAHAVVKHTTLSSDKWCILIFLILNY